MPAIRVVCRREFFQVFIVMASLVVVYSSVQAQTTAAIGTEPQGTGTSSVTVNSGSGSSLSNPISSDPAISNSTSPNPAADPSSSDAENRDGDEANGQQSTAAGTSGSSDSFTNGPNDWVHRWLRNVDKTRSEQPHYAAPLITTHVLLVQQFRFDSFYQSAAPSGLVTEEYGGGKGLEIIPNTRMEVQVGIPPYFFHQAAATPDGFGDVSIFLKLRVASAPEGKGGYFFGFFLGGSFPSGSPPNGLGHTVWSPIVAAAKRWGWFDWQTNFGGVLPQSGTATLGRQIVFNNTFQLNAAKVFWPEVETNSTFFVDGPNSGSSQTFLTPGLVIGPFQIAERLHLIVGGGVQTAVSGFYQFNHRWIWSVRFPF